MNTLFDHCVVERFLTASAVRGQQSGIGSCHFLTRHGRALAAMLRGDATEQQVADLHRELDMMEQLNGSKP